MKHIKYEWKTKAKVHLQAVQPLREMGNEPVDLQNSCLDTKQPFKGQDLPVLRTWQGPWAGVSHLALLKRLLARKGLPALPSPLKAPVQTILTFKSSFFSC